MTGERRRYEVRGALTEEGQDRVYQGLRVLDRQVSLQTCRAAIKKDEEKRGNALQLDSTQRLIVSRLCCRVMGRKVQWRCCC